MLVWAVVSLIGALAVCGDLFASRAGSSSPSVVTSHTSPHHHINSHHWHEPFAISLAAGGDSLAGAPGPVDLSFSTIQSTDPERDLPLAVSSRVSGFIAHPGTGPRLHPGPPPVFPPKYLLFHRLLIAHL